MMLHYSCMTSLTKTLFHAKSLIIDQLGCFAHKSNELFFAIKMHALDSSTIGTFRDVTHILEY